ncbi:DUF3784 domain-containing protein [Natrinema salifodinae]|uniref:DUF3784 domain-containing protein n=1 Tax=Natrinema salifodinae TaxID=1202768 RepID=A0A1I0PE99_9EURY|nr:DUF3784 domain-containing protein [Natrinema salifodinae]SEW12623.1 protein of unknown function [Natrinema salifodinae]
MSLVRLAIVLSSGIFTVALGYQIRYRGMVRLVAGYDPEEVVDGTGLARFVGGLLIAVGAVTAAIGVLDYLDRGGEVLWYAFSAFVIVATAVVIVGSNRYTRS